jgi:hypothetical protein
MFLMFTQELLGPLSLSCILCWHPEVCRLRVVYVCTLFLFFLFLNVICHDYFSKISSLIVRSNLIPIFHWYVRLFCLFQFFFRLILVMLCGLHTFLSLSVIIILNFHWIQISREIHLKLFSFIPQTIIYFYFYIGLIIKSRIHYHLATK